MCPSVVMRFLGLFTAVVCCVATNSLSPDVRLSEDELEEEQKREDMAHVTNTPQLDKKYEDAGAGLGRLLIGEHIASSFYSTIFDIEGDRPIIIKYQGSCPTVDNGVPPLVLDYRYGLIAAAAGAAARPLFLSPEAPMDGYCMRAGKCRGHKGALKGDKLQFDIFGEDTYETDPARPHATEYKRNGRVRYMIMERVGSSLNEELLMDPPMSPIKAIDFGIQLIQLLQNLHGAGLIHGDVHPGNVCRRLENPNSILLIDFGGSTTLSKETDEIVFEFFENENPTLSPWQLEGHAVARRDDVYSALFTLAGMMLGVRHRDSHMEAIRERAAAKWGFRSRTVRGNREVLKWKRNGPLFKTHSFDPIAEMWPKVDRFTIKKINEVHDGLNKIHKTVMDLKSVKTPIPYQSIVDQLQLVQELMRQAIFD